MRASRLLDERSQPAGRAGVLLPRGGDGLDQLVVHALQAGPQQLVAVGEVDVDGRAGHPGLGGDLVHGDVGRAPLAEEPAGRVDDLVAAEVPDDLLQLIGRPAGRTRSARRAGADRRGR